MIGSDYSVRVLHPIPGLAWTEMREAAMDFARQGWPVLPGTYQLAKHACWLGKRGAAGLEPVAGLWQLSAIADPAIAVEVWTQRPYSVLLACGTAVDALEVPASLGESAHSVLDALGCLGPIAVTPFSTWLLFVRCGGELKPELADRTRLHGPGSWVPLPPSSRSAVPYRWRVPPAAMGWALPDPDAVQGALIDSAPPSS